ncbi:MAG: TrkA family potassium uptake protein [Syntrophobacteraceae bacterium]|nr:TrkA family potassium uptake protein [Syntrophobacteraceae bacterium]
MGQIAIMGLGNFGYYLGRELYLKGYDVIGLDVQRDVVQKAKNDLSQAVVADATDKETLLALGIGQVDLAVVAIGTNMLASILATFHLKEIGVKKVFAKALSEEHGQILSRMGADEIFFPEKDLAVSLARKIENPNLLEYLPSVQDYGIFELEEPTSLIGKSLREMDLINRFGIQVLAVRDREEDRLAFIPRGDYVVRKGDVLILLGTSQSMERLTKELAGRSPNSKD